MMSPLKKYITACVLVVLVATACSRSEKHPVMFTLLTVDSTGLNFVNKLTPTDSFNMFKYMYFYNGAGIGAADFNNDGLIDLFFASNQQQNKLYLNTGGMHFKDVTKEAGIPDDKQWSTGVSVVDINNDGLMDLYVCRVGNFENLHGANQLLICQGIKNGVPLYKDEAVAYGLNFSGFSTQAAFFDYDMDGDLDMFLLNHSVHQNGTFAERKLFLGTYNELSGDRLYRNDKGKFTDVTKTVGINSSAIGYGLGICVADINLDGYPDLYIGNDFHENDYLYINQHNGTFKEELNDHIMHTSQFSMGVDVADADNDAYPEIISMDMLPSDPYILKRSLGEDEYNVFNMKINAGYNYQYTRNNLQWNRRNGMFSETGLYSGVSATDWSWAPLWMDFDNDGLKDLFISNGIPKRLNDIDYVNYVSNGEVQEKIKANRIDQKEMALVNKFPEIKLPNRFYKNMGDMQFKDMGENIARDLPTFSNGAIYADLDNDGDLDVVVNNVDDAAMVYRNASNDTAKNNYAEITLKGDSTNIHAVGARVVVFTKNKQVRTYEKYPARGFLSSMDIPVHIGLSNTVVDSAVLIWPDNSFQQINLQQPKQAVIYKKGLPKFDFQVLTKRWPSQLNSIDDITQSTGLLYKHQENNFVEFDREPLIPHMVSKEGPALAIADINHDGLDDVFIGSAKRFKSAIFLQTKEGKFIQQVQPAIEQDSMYEDVDACWVDVNNDHHPDLVVASGGNEYYGKDERMQPRVYLNDGKGNLTKEQHAFDGIYLTASCVAPYDFDGDGKMDLFIGARCVPWEYGQSPVSYLLKNDGTGRFKDVTKTYGESIQNAGLVTSALWIDIDKNGSKDLVVTQEWGEIVAFMNNKGSFTKQELTTKKGWWNFVLPCDIDNDGDLDFIAGNLGLNSRLKASPEQPVRLYYNDFDGNGKKEQVLTYYLNGKEIPFATKDELQRQMPVLKKKFLYAEDFAKATLAELFDKEKLDDADKLTADYFSNAVLLNKGNGVFETKALPWQAQLSPYKDAIVVNANNDTLPDIFIAGNFYENNIEMGRYDADYGTILVNKGNGAFECQSVNGLNIKGQVRKIRQINIAGKQAMVLVRNNDSAMVLKSQN
ncbi:VCBS repeat-containing protein [Danxiaibacter flavus]|uniref:VCBS repeat-containing protein n=1 Tax=Danxiaibacter flavus TaxID=3049108 RepID=A0ABV3ZF00_9BACT|nr:VCBS repeat-containing protein [Chitinophagaceae bacterium DXS]